MKKVYIKSILNKHKKRDEWFLDDYSINPYSGCTFGCVYCYIKGSKYGEHKENGVYIKANAAEILEKQLKRRALKKEYGFIAVSTSTEPYQYIERKTELTRKLLKIISNYRFPVHILTKSSLVLRDLDILKEIDKNAILPEDLKTKLQKGVIINFSISTLNEKLAKALEPGAPSPLERLKTMKKCKQHDFFTGISYIPVLPYLSDSEQDLQEMIKTAKSYGADFVFVGALTLFGNKPSDSRFKYYKFLDKNYPELLTKYRKLYRIFTQPPLKYQQNLEEKAREICNKYNINLGIA